MIVIGLVLVALFVLAFAGSALDDAPRTPSEPSPVWGVVLFVAVLTGIVLRKHKEKQDDEF